MPKLSQATEQPYDLQTGGASSGGGTRHERPHKPLFFDIAATDEQNRLEENVRRYWRKWLGGIDLEQECEPNRIREIYDVKITRTRIGPVGPISLRPQS